MFKKDKNSHATVSVVIDDQRISLPKGTSIAAGLLGEGELISRISPSSGKPCAPHCLMGVCCECMMEIDGVKRQACMTEPREGMVINRGLDTEEGGNYEPAL